MCFTSTPDKSVYLKIIFLNFSTKPYVVGTQNSKEQSQLDVSFEHPKHRFKLNF